MEDHFYDSRSLALGGAPELSALRFLARQRALRRSEPPKSTCALIAERCAALNASDRSLSFTR
jgi:hypothetical protein